MKVLSVMSVVLGKHSALSCSSCGHAACSSSLSVFQPVAPLRTSILNLVFKVSGVVCMTNYNPIYNPWVVWEEVDCESRAHTQSLADMDVHECG